MSLSHSRATAFTLVALALLALPVAAQPRDDPPEPRVEIALFDYEGTTEGSRSAEQFNVFKGIVKRKIDNLYKQVLQDQASSGDAVAYLGQVYLEPRGADTFRKRADVMLWMQNEGIVLNVLRGTIASDDGIHYTVFTQFYLAKHSDHEAIREVAVELPVHSDELANTRDTHTLVILYALAMEAERAGWSSSQVAMFLSVAERIIADLERRSGELTGDLAEIKKAVQLTRDEILGGD